MEDEIKEILARLSRYVITPDVRHDFDDLLNYITNLQTIKQQYSSLLSENAELENKITNLQKIYDKALTDLVHESHKRIELEDRINKAIEYNNKNIHSQTLDNILQGEDNEN